MPRDTSGNYTLPAGNPVVGGTTIQPSWANPTLADVATGITNSLSRNGNGGMLAGLPGFDGTVSLPGYAFTNELGSGLYRASSNDIRMGVGGNTTMRWIDDTATAAGSQQPVQYWDGSAWVPIGSNLAPFVEDSATNTVTDVLSLTHTTTGTPAVGFGTGLAFIAETSAGNNETGMVLEAVTTNVGAGTEAFDFVVKLMAGGAAAAEAFRVSSAGAVSLTSLEATNLDGILGANTPAAATVTSFAADSGATIGTLTLADGSITDSGGAISFGSAALGTTGTARTGNLGIGKAASSYAIDIESATGGAAFNMTRTAGSVFSMGMTTAGGTSMSSSGASGYLSFGTGSTAGSPSERARFNTSGHFLVGKNATGFATAGIELRSDNTIYSTTSAGPALSLNRLTSSGPIADFYYSNSLHGRVGSTGGTLYIDGAGTGVGIEFQAAGLRPRQNGTASNNTMSLGDASYKWATTYSTRFVAGTGRLTIDGNAIYDPAGTGNNVGITFGSTGLLPTNGAGAGADNTLDLGSSSYYMRTGYFKTDIAIGSSGGSVNATRSKFWVNYNTTGTAAIQDSYNVTSITDNAVGNITVTIATNFGDADWASSMSSPASFTQISGSSAKTAGTITVLTLNTTPALIDIDDVSVIGHGNQ